MYMHKVSLYECKRTINGHLVFDVDLIRISCKSNRYHRLFNAMYTYIVYRFMTY